MSHFLVYSIGMHTVVAPSLSYVQLFAIPWTIAHQDPLSMEFSWQKYWSGLPFPSPGDLLHPEIELGLLHCKQILYHLSHQGSPTMHISSVQSLSCVRLFAAP